MFRHRQLIDPHLASVPTVVITATDVAELVGFYTLYHDKKEGKYRMQVCTDLPCALRGAEQFMDNLCGSLGIKVGETTPDGVITLEAVTCLAACDKAPMFQLQSGDDIEYHENMTVERTMELVETLRRARKGAASWRTRSCGTATCRASTR